MRILVIEDDQEVSDYILKGFTEAGHTVDVADTGTNGLFLATSEDYDVLVVDRMLPEVDGLKVIKTLRGAGDMTPVLILSALADVDDRIKGLRAGGDDYLVKPFAFTELLVRVEALNRRASQNDSNADTVLEARGLKLDLLSRKVEVDDEIVDLQPREFKLLQYLMRHKGQVVTRTMLLENVWHYHFDPQTNVIDVHISRLRAKLDGDSETSRIKTVRGAGYIIEDD